MLISHRYKFIYIKTPKTAGTSVEVALDDLCCSDGHARDKSKIHFTQALESDSGIIGARGYGVDKSSWYNHMSPQAIKTKIGSDIWENYYKFCNIRNPFDQNVSFFHFQNKDMKNHPKGDIIKNFRTWISSGRILSDHTYYMEDDNIILDGFIRYKKLENDINSLMIRFGLEPRELPRLKSENRGHNKIDYREYYDEDTTHLVAEKCHWQIKYFSWAYPPQ